MTTFPPSPAQGETAGVTLADQLSFVEMITKARIFISDQHDALIAIAASLRLLDVARQQLAELQRECEKSKGWIKHLKEQAQRDYHARKAAEQQLAEMRETIEHIREYWNGSYNELAMADALDHIVSVCNAALAPTPQPSRGKCETWDELIAVADNFKLPIDVKIGAGTFTKGVKVGTAIRCLKNHAGYASEIPDSEYPTLGVWPDCAQPERQGADDACPHGCTTQEEHDSHSPPQDDIVAGLRREADIGLSLATGAGIGMQGGTTEGEMRGHMASMAHALYRAIAALGEKGCAREAVIRECWDAINKYIKPGTLPGNGCDESAQRNGMILASNVLMDMMVKS
jgi:hypothetical protein